MPELGLHLFWGVEKAHPWPWNIEAACDAFERRTGQRATHCQVSTTAPPPPVGCLLAWRVSLNVRPGVIAVGVEVAP